MDQEASFAAQQEELQQAGCTRLYREQVSAVAKQRPQLERALDHLRAGDVLVVTKLDRLARSVEHLLALVRRIEASQASLRILGLGLDTATPTGRLMLTTLGAVAEFERSLMLERQKVGIERAKAEGVYKGRKPTAGPRQWRCWRSSRRGSGRRQSPSGSGSAGPASTGCSRRPPERRDEDQRRAADPRRTPAAVDGSPPPIPSTAAEVWAEGWPEDKEPRGPKAPYTPGGIVGRRLHLGRGTGQHGRDHRAQGRMTF